MYKGTLVFATNNAHKLKEIQHAAGDKLQLLSLNDINCADDIPETGKTLEENALQKARFLFEKYGCNCFADDTGLEVEALQGEPGVYSARYAGEQKNAGDNMNLVLQKMRGAANRNAQFRTVVALIMNGKEHLFEGIVKGSIRHEKSGGKGFGYDPIFQPAGYSITFAEMSMEDKNKISHRGKAVERLVEFLRQWQ